NLTVSGDTLDQDNETYAVTLSNVAGPASLGSPSAATVYITDDDLPPYVEFSGGQVDQGGSYIYTVAEDAGSKTITVNLTGPSGKTISVDYSTVEAFATAGDDYTAVSGTLTFTPGQTSKTFSVPIVNDDVAEGDEEFEVLLSNGFNVFGTPADAWPTITNVA